MTEDEKKELFARLDDMHGLQLGLSHVLALLITTAPKSSVDIMKAHLPKLDVAMEGVRLNSGYSDRILEVAEASYRQLTAPLR